MREGFYVEHAKLDTPFPNSPLHKWAVVRDFYTTDVEAAIAEMRRRKALDPESDFRVTEVRVVACTR